MVQNLEGMGPTVVPFCRQLLFILPTAWVSTLFITYDLANAWIVWLTFPIAEIVTTAIAAGLMSKAYKKVKPLQN